MLTSKKPLPHSLHICLVSKKFPILGRAADHSYLWLIARKLTEKGHRVKVLAAHSPQQKKTIEQDGVSVYYLNQDYRITEKNYQNVVRNKFSELHREEPFDIVHCVDSSGSKIIKNHKQFKVATALDVEATNVAQLFSILAMTQESLGGAIRTSLAVLYKFIRTYFGSDRKLIKQAHGIFVSSPQQRLLLERNYLYPDRRIYTLAYGIEMSEASSEEKVAQLKEQLGILPETKIILSISDMVELQEVKNLLQAFERVVIKKPEVRMILVGNGPRRREIEFETYRLALGNMVTFVGAIKNTEVPDYIGLGNIYATLSSRTTGFEPSVLEAMNQKKLVVASELSALSSLIEDRKDGFLVRPADIAGIANLLLEILNDTLPTLEIGDSAHRKVLNFFDPDKMLNDTIDAYYSILRTSGLYNKRKQ